MTLYTPTHKDAEILLTSPSCFLDWAVAETALPPPFLLTRTIGHEADGWLMPRLFVDDDNHEIVGSACYISAPKDRKVEVGYGISPQRRGRGYATMGVALLVEEALASGLVDSVLASSTPSNTASKRVLEKSGFVIYGAGVDEDEGPVDLWIMKRSSNSDAAPTPLVGTPNS